MYETVNTLLHLQLASICVTWDGDWVRPPAVRQWWQHLGLQTAASLTVIQHCSIDWRKDWKLQYRQEQFLKNCKTFFVLEVKCKQTPLDVLLFCAEWVACKSSCRSFFMFYSISVELSAKKQHQKRLIHRVWRRIDRIVVKSLNLGAYFKWNGCYCTAFMIHLKIQILPQKILLSVMKH